MPTSAVDPLKKVRLPRDWRSAGPTSASGMQLSCSLARKLTCCDGKGYQIAAKGALATATLCSCVKACPACLGRARQVSGEGGNDSSPCRTPQPNVVVNLLNAARIPARYAAATVPRFRNFTGNGREVLAELERWKAQLRPGHGPGVILEGPVGVGKTYLLAALAKEFAERGYSVRFTDFFQLLGELKAGYSQGKADASQLAPLIDVDLLFIDELGKGRNNDFELTILDQLVCGRYNQQKTIIASTNYALKGRSYKVNQELDSKPGGSADFASDQFTALEQRIGPRIFSRLREMTNFLELRGSDWRREELRRGNTP